MRKKNAEIRQALKEARVKQWEVASVLGISEATMVRRLRRELPEKEKARILQVIEQLKDQAC